jgi:hypothetical protein
MIQVVGTHNGYHRGRPLISWLSRSQDRNIYAVHDLDAGDMYLLKEQDHHPGHI